MIRTSIFDELCTLFPNEVIEVQAWLGGEQKHYCLLFVANDNYPHCWRVVTCHDGGPVKPEWRTIATEVTYAEALKLIANLNITEFNEAAADWGYPVMPTLS